MWGKRHIISIFISLSFLTICSGIEEQNKLSIDVYFESLCPDSLNFVKNQLYPSWEDISEYVNLKLIPFGKSVSLENATKFVCQHGPLECKGNRIMSCAISRIPDQNLQVEYVNCFMDVFQFTRSNREEFGQQCAELIELDFSEIETCYRSREGTVYQLEAEEKTKQAWPKFVPTIIYNGQFHQELQDSSLRNFRDVVCNLIKNTYPESCPKKKLLISI